MATTPASPLLVDLYDNRERLSDIALTIGDRTFFFDSVILKSQCAELLAFFKSNGFIPTSVCQALYEDNQDKTCKPYVSTKWTLKITDEQIVPELMDLLQKDIYQVASMDTQLKSDDMSVPYFLRYFNLTSYQYRYYSLHPNIGFIDPASPYYPDRALIFLSKKNISEKKWKETLWSFNPEVLLSVLRNDQFAVPSSCTEDQLAEELGKYLADNVSDLTESITHKLLLCLNPKWMSKDFIVEKLPTICTNPLTYFELMQPNSKTVSEQRRFFSSPGYAVCAYEKRDTFPSYKTVDKKHFEEHMEEIKQLLMSGKIPLLEKFVKQFKNTRIFIESGTEIEMLVVNNNSVCIDFDLSTNEYIMLKNVPSTIENIFSHKGNPHGELVLCYRG